MRKKGFSQAEVVKQIESYHSIFGKYDRAEMRPTIGVVKKMAEVLDTIVGYFLEKRRT